MVEYIYYTGVGSKKDGKHTVKEFLDIMNSHFKIDCSNFLKSYNVPPCEKYKQMNRDDLLKTIKNQKFKRSRKREKKYKKLIKECNKRIKTFKKRDCNFKEYIDFSGAEENNSFK
jgi:hemerythrin